MDYTVHGILQARILEWVAAPFSLGWIFPTQELNPGLLHCRQILYQLSYQGSPILNMLKMYHLSNISKYHIWYNAENLRFMLLYRYIAY